MKTPWIESIPRWAQFLIVLGVWQLGQIIFGAVDAKYSLLYDEVSGETPFVVVKSTYWGWVTEEARASIKPYRIDERTYYELDVHPEPGFVESNYYKDIDYSSYINPEQKPYRY